MQRGLDRFHEQDPQKLLRDTRTIGQRINDFFGKSLYGAIVFMIVAIVFFVYPALIDFVSIIMVGLFFYAYSLAKKATLPFRLPERSKAKDYNDPLPGKTLLPRTARGISFFGNDRKTQEELWFSNDDMRTHVLIFGSTGSGKTEALVSISYNALIQSSGLIYVDGKGDNSLFSKIFSMARSMGREDDVLLINFMTGARDVVGAQETRLSNTMNPFALGSSSMLAGLATSLMDSGGGGGDGDMWKGRAIAFIEALMRVLVYMRDQDILMLDANSIRNYFHLTKLESIVVDKVFPRDNAEPISMQDVPFEIVEPLLNYVINLPGYDKTRKGKQVSQVLEQHGFITMQLTRAFGSLADTYGHIIRTKLAEVDMADVVLNRRILIVLLPALEKSPEELSNLGKIIVATLRAMMASGLGDRVEGRFTEVIERKPTNAPTPFMCILDEYGYYAVKGFAVVPAQARSLGFSTIFAGQDLPAFQKASKEEAASIGANTNIKICMKLEDPTDTWEFFMKTAGEAQVTKVDAFQTDAQSLMNNYMDTRSSSVEKRSRIDLLDLKDQREGEFHVFFKSTIVRGAAFYANPTIVAYMRLNHFLKVEKPTVTDLINMNNVSVNFFERLETDEKIEIDVEGSEEINLLVGLFAETEEENLIEKSVSALIAYQSRLSDMDQEQVAEAGRTEVVPGEEEVYTHLSIFAKVNITELSREIVGDYQSEQFSQPLLNKRASKEKVELIERVIGSTTSHATDISWEVVRDMEIATDYPPEIEAYDQTLVVNASNDILAYIKQLREAPPSEK
jgi:intracellular multiplication protein IcmO